MTNARTPPGRPTGAVSGTSGMLEPHGSNRRTVAPGVACTLRGIPSASGSSTLPAGAKLVVSIHAARPGGGRNCGATRAGDTKALESDADPGAALTQRA